MVLPVPFEVSPHKETSVVAVFLALPRPWLSAFCLRVHLGGGGGRTLFGAGLRGLVRFASPVGTSLFEASSLSYWWRSLELHSSLDVAWPWSPRPLFAGGVRSLEA